MQQRKSRNHSTNETDRGETKIVARIGPGVVQKSLLAYFPISTSSRIQNPPARDGDRVLAIALQSTFSRLEVEHDALAGLVVGVFGKEGNKSREQGLVETDHVLRAEEH